MPTIQQIESDPAFAKLNFAEQGQVRSTFFEKAVATAPGFSALEDGQKMSVFNAFVDRMPVLETKSSDFFRAATDTVTKMKFDAPTGLKEAINLSAMRTGTKTMLFPTLVAKGIDAVASMVDPDQEDPLYADYYGRDGEKVDQWLKMQIYKNGGQGAMQTLGKKTMAVGLVGGFAEFALETAIFAGVGAAVGGAAGASMVGTGGMVAKGAARGASMGANILTGNATHAAVQAALSTGAFSAPLARNLLAITAEGIQSGIAQTGLDLFRIGLQEGFKNKTSNAIWTEIAQNYGTNVAMNYVGWGVVKAAGVVFKAGAKTIKGVKIDPMEEWIDTFMVGTNPAAKASALRYVTETVAPMEAAARMGHIDPKSKNGFTVLAQSVGWEAEFDINGKITMTSIANPDFKLLDLDRKTASYRLGEIMTTEIPALQLKPNQLATTLKGQAIAASSESQLIKQTVYKMNNTMAPEQVSHMLFPENGVTNPAKMRMFARSYLLTQGVPLSMVDNLGIEQVVKAGKKASSEMNLVVPTSVKTIAEEQRLVKTFIDDLDKIVKDRGTKAFVGPMNLNPPSIAANHSSFSALDAAAQKLGINVKTINNQIIIEGTKFTSVREANAYLLNIAHQSGKLSTDQLSSIIYQRSGLTLKQIEKNVMSPDGPAEQLAKRTGGDAKLTVPVFVLEKPNSAGGIVKLGEAADLDTLLKAHPEIDPRLPSTMAPSTYIVDDTLKTITVQNNVVIGSASQILDVTGNFSSPIQKEVLSEFGNSFVEKDILSSSYIVRNETVGAWAEFSSPKVANKYMKEVTSSVQQMRDAFGMRDMKLEYAQNGSLVGTSADGSTKLFKTMAEAQDWLKKAPYPEWMVEILPVQPTLIADAKKQIGQASEALLQELPDHHIFGKKKPGRGTFSRFVEPTEMALVVGQRQHGKGDLLNYYRQIRNGFRLVQGVDAKSDSQIDILFKGVKYDDKVLYQVLLGNDKAHWDQIAQDGFGKKLSEVDLKKLSDMESFYEAAFTIAGIPDYKRVLSYAPRLKDYAKANPNDIIESFTAGEYLKKAFGGTPAGYEFFGEKARSSDLLKVALFEDAEQVMRTYTYALNKHRLMDTLIKDIKTGVTELEGKFPKAELNFFQGALDEMQSASQTRGASMFKQDSKQAIMGIQSLMQKVPGLRAMPMANAPVVGDIIDLINSRVTLSTQAKPWAVFRNMAQISLLGAAIGDNNLMWNSFKSIVLDNDDVWIKRLMESGAVTGAGFVGGQPNSNLGYWRRLMKWNENMDIVTRATAFKAADTMLNTHWTKFSKGLITADVFTKKAGLSILDEPIRLTVIDALHRGDMKFAVDQFGDALNRLCFFDYSKVNRATFQRGMMGKVFGKFGTYPSSTIALYHRILTSGSAGERVARASRMVLTSMAVYEGAKMMGIDYKGFLWTDPFAFQGGPLWHILSDGSSIIGDSSQAKMARKSLLRNLPRLMSPTINTYTQVKKAIEWLDKDDLYSAILALIGVPVRRDLDWEQRRQ